MRPGPILSLERGDLCRQLIDAGLQRDLLVGGDAGPERRELRALERQQKATDQPDLQRP